jgi:hypothetical protein
MSQETALARRQFLPKSLFIHQQQSTIAHLIGREGGYHTDAAAANLLHQDFSAVQTEGIDRRRRSEIEKNVSKISSPSTKAPLASLADSFHDQRFVPLLAHA